MDRNRWAKRHLNPASWFRFVGLADANYPLDCCAIGCAHGVLQSRDQGPPQHNIRPQLIRDQFVWDKAIFSIIRISFRSYTRNWVVMV
jgi:hypothetical protein